VGSLILTPDAGDCILFDYRLNHRGLGNKSQSNRALLYLTYAVPWWRDPKNFSSSRYLKLPHLPQAIIPTTSKSRSSKQLYTLDDDEEEAPAERNDKQAGRKNMAPKSKSKGK
jgi:hypothetical protein